MHEINYEEMGKKIRQKRENLGITQEKMAEKLDISTSYYGQIERGDAKCSLVVVVNIATTLDLNLDTLVRGIDEQNTDTAILEVLNTIPQADKKQFVILCDNLANAFR